MTYFNLRKREPEAEPDEVEEEPEETVEEAEDGEEEEQPGKQHGPLLTGLFGPGQWLAARFGTGPAWGVHVVAVWAIGFYGGWIAAGVLLVWLLAVLAFVPREHLERLAKRIEKRGGEAPDDTPEAEPLGPGQGLARWLLDTIGERPGIHVRELYPAMRELPGQGARTDADLKALLRAFGVPVHRSLRIGRIAGRSGVRREDVAALLPFRGERRVDSAVSAGQDTDSPPLSAGGEGVETARTGLLRGILEARNDGPRRVR
jgi:hypothetical protein